MKVRFYQKGDAKRLEKLFYDTIRNVNLGDYTQLQVEAWAPDKRDINEWETSFENKLVFVAEENGQLAGFGELENDGHIGRFYVAKEYIGKGVGKNIYFHLEDYAKKNHIRSLYVEASITAKPFFLAMGFSEVEKQTVNLNGIDFINYVMNKKVLEI